MPNEHGKTIDKTFLSVDMAEKRGFIHRDYIAHCLRWSHVIKFLQEKKLYSNANILDIGCGKETPLLKTLYSSRLIPMSYTGVDVGPINHPGDALVAKFPVTLKANTNILEYISDVKYKVVVMFEALEHMEPDAGISVLKHIQSFMLPDSTLFISTPCYDGVNKAGNHVYEWDYEELRSQLLVLEYDIKNVWGTFASIKDYREDLKTIDGLSYIFDELRSYYDVNLLAVIFAPLFPSHSRNCLWQLTI
jgi:2-polyprenyl-3-methyl-5-hydroxy-6-metoxy-1,4-benzoquinol methylase